MLKHLFPFVIVFKLLYKELSNIKGLIFLFSTILILSSLMLLKNYQVFFEKHYISYLKSIYPHNFTNMKSIKKHKIKNIQYSDEIYEISLEDMKLFFHKGKTYKQVHIKSIGVRSFEINHIPEIIKDIYQKNTIFISDKLYDKITSNKDYADKISFNNPNYSFDIKPFKSHLENDYILMSNDIGKKMFSLSRFNIVNIYSLNKEHSKKDIFNLFKEKNIRIINWQDRLPFFNKLFFGIYEKISFIYIIVFSLLVITFMVFFLSSLLEDIQKAFKQILYLGNNFFYAFLIIFFVVFLFTWTIFSSSYIGFYFFNDFIITYLLKDFSINLITSFSKEIIYLLFLIFSFSFLYTLYYKLSIH